MGFILWLDEECAWAQGTYEYSAMGAAVIAATDLFRARDFSSRRRGPATRDPRLAGWFASLGAVNSYLLKRRAPRRRERPIKPRVRSQASSAPSPRLQ